MAFNDPTNKRPSLGKTGNATIDKAGHTSNGRGGSDPGKQPNRGAVKPQGIK